MNDKTKHPADPQTRAYMQELDAQIDALEARLGAARQTREQLQQGGISGDPRLEPVMPAAASESSRSSFGGRRWLLGAAAAVVAVGAGLTYAGGSGTPELPRAISLQDRVSVASASDAAASTSEINVVPAPLFTLDDTDSPFDERPALGGPGGVDMTDSFDSPYDSYEVPATVSPSYVDHTASVSPDDVYEAAPGAPAPAPFGDDSLTNSFSPDQTTSFDSPDNT